MFTIEEIQAEAKQARVPTEIEIAQTDKGVRLRVKVTRGSFPLAGAEHDGARTQVAVQYTSERGGWWLGDADPDLDLAIRTRTAAFSQAMVLTRLGGVPG